jgi:hypothetical protein
VTDIAVTVWEDRNTVLFSGTLANECWAQSSPFDWRWNAGCGTAAPFTSARLRARFSNGTTAYHLMLKAQGSFGIQNLTGGGGGTELLLTIDGVKRATTGGRCRKSGTAIMCARYD